MIPDPNGYTQARDVIQALQNLLELKRQGVGSSRSVVKPIKQGKVPLKTS